ncbi:MAG: hypothetical protein J6K64_04360 [Clostridia bacterium]|nr:hypothetical protein [Clostridia bacterium]
MKRKITQDLTATRFPCIEIYTHPTGSLKTEVDVYVDGKKISDCITAVRYEHQAGGLAKVTIDYLSDNVSIIESEMNPSQTKKIGLKEYSRSWIRTQPPQRARKGLWQRLRRKE